MPACTEVRTLSKFTAACIAVLVASVCITAGAMGGELVEFPDPNLAQALSEALGIPAAEITTTVMETLSSLDAKERGIRHLDGLEHGVNLEELNLWGNEISELQPLQNLTQLQMLWLGGNEISVLQPLQNLTQLQVLSLWRNRIGDLSPLSGLTQLKQLRLQSNMVSDLAPLAGLIRLTRLELADNRIDDLTPLSALTKLERLDLAWNRITDISPLVDNSDAGGFSSGDRILLRYNYLSLDPDSDAMEDLETLLARKVELDYLPQLVLISASSSEGGLINPDGEVSVLYGSEQSFTITPYPDYRVDDVLVDDVSVLDGLAFHNGSATYTFTNVTSPYAIHAQFVSPLVEFGDPNLEQAVSDALDVPPGAITTALIKTLTTLDASGQGITSLEGLEQATNLRHLLLAGNDIDDITALSALLILRKLDLRGNRISHLSPLATLTELEVLLLSNNLLSSILPLIENSDAGGLGAGDRLALLWNNLDTSPSSEALKNIQKLINRGVNVLFDPQRNPPCPVLLRGWTLLGLPVEPDDPDPGALVIDPAPVHSYLYRWGPDTRRYLAAHRPGEITQLQALHAYWLFLPRDRATYTLSITGTHLAETRSVGLGPAGWQMVGVPYPIAWGDVDGGRMFLRLDDTEKTLAEALSSGWILDTLYAWDSAEGNWFRHRATDGATLTPWTGYFLYTLRDDLELIFTDTPSPWPAYPALNPAALTSDPGEPPFPTLPRAHADGGLVGVAFPNPPGTEHVTFAVRGLGEYTVEAIRVRVHDLSGVLVHKAEGTGTQLTWDMARTSGDPLATGVYLYTIEARIGGAWLSTALGKLLILQ